MRCCLLQPPLCDPSCPPLGLAYLSAILKEQSIEHELFDLNLDFIDFISMLVQDNLDRERIVAVQRFGTTLDVVNRFYPEIKVSSFTLDIPKAEGRLTDIAATALDADGLFSRWIRNSDPITKVLASNPDWIGISVSFFGQLPAAIALAVACKRRSQAGIVLGGALFKDFETWIGPRTILWEYADGVVVGAGEDILRSFHKTEDGRILPSLGRVDLPGGGWIAKSSKRVVPPRPDFSRFLLQSYKASGLVLPYRIYACCSWNKCAFCADSKYATHLPMAKGRFEDIISEIERIVKSYGVQGIYFLDAELPEQFMLTFAKYLSHREMFLRWGANARFSKGLIDPKRAEQLFAGGCRFLRFGLESASPRVLKLMNKGIHPSMAEDILTSVHKAGIATHVYLMRGFPGETNQEWQITENFLLDNAAVIDMFNVSIFQLYDGSPLSRKLGSDLLSSEATQNRWVHPQLLNQKWFEEDFKDIEQAFFRLKGLTRCHPTPADTILLADKLSLNYTTNASEKRRTPTYEPQKTGPNH